MCRDIKEIFDKNPAQDLKNVLVEAVKINEHTGSSTCVLVKFDTERPDYLLTTNLGDSGYFVFRPDPEDEYKLKNKYKSKTQ